MAGISIMDRKMDGFIPLNAHTEQARRAGVLDDTAHMTGIGSCMLYAAGRAGVLDNTIRLTEHDEAILDDVIDDMYREGSKPRMVELAIPDTIPQEILSLVAARQAGKAVLSTARS